MKNPLETLIIPAGSLLLAFFSAPLLPAPSFGLPLAEKLMVEFHMIDLNQLCTTVFAGWFLLLGVAEFLVIRYLWRKFT